MSPTPVTFTSPTAPASYSLGGDRRAGRGPVRRGPGHDRPLRPEHLPHPAGARRTSCWRPDGSRRRCPNTRRPTTAASIEAAAARYGVDPSELIVGAGADEILDIVAKAFITGGGSAVVPVPTYAMYRVVTEQRGGDRRGRATPRPNRPGSRSTRRPSGRPSPTRGATVVWLCSPNNPTALAEPDGTIAALLAALADDAAAAGREPPIVVLDEAYAEFVGTLAARPPRRLPEPHRGPDREQGLRPRRACGSGSASPGPR